jgi:hypothetical protein
VLFWRQIITNITIYDELTDEQKDYYNQDNILLEIDDGTLGDSIICNETKSNGRDFMLCRSTIEHLKKAETLIDVQKSFRKPNKCQGVFGFESDEDSDEDCVKIRQDKPPVIEEVDTIEGNLEAAFNAFLRTSNENMLNPIEIRKKLMNENVLSSHDDLQRLPFGVQSFLKQMNFFKQSISQVSSYAESEGNQSSEKENENSLDIPSNQSSRRSLRSRNNFLKKSLASSTPFRSHEDKCNQNLK